MGGRRSFCEFNPRLPVVGKIEREEGRQRRGSGKRRTDRKGMGTARGTGRGGGGGGDGEEGKASWRFVTFFGFQLLQHPRLLALFAVGLRLHVLSQIPWKGTRTDSGLAGGQGSGQAQGTQRQPPAGRPWLPDRLRPCQLQGLGRGLYSSWDVQPQPPFRAASRNWGVGWAVRGHRV